MTAQINILVVDDNDLLRLGIVAAIKKYEKFDVAGEARNGQDALDKFNELKPDVVLMDVGMPIMDGIEATRKIKMQNHQAKVIMLTSHNADVDVYTALSAGANGYCLKDIEMDRLYEAIAAVSSGDLWLDSSIAGKVVSLCSKVASSSDNQDNTVQRPCHIRDLEREVLKLLAGGLHMDEIAVHLNLSRSSVKAYIVNALSKVAFIGELTHNEDAPVISSLNDKYENLGLLGSGGMSDVYKARHKMMDRMVAIKLLKGTAWQNPDAHERFTREARITSRLSHPNIIGVHDFGIDDNGQPYLVMDYIDGPPLNKVLDGGVRLPEAEAIQMFQQITDALSYAHQRGVIHRDVKPANILLSFPANGSINVKIVDFGIAHSVSTDESQRLTQFGQVIGSPVYMSPEQCQGQELDARCDIYSLGCVMFETLAGSPPFCGNNAMATMNMHMFEPAPLLQDVSEPMRTLIDRCLRKNPDERFSSLQEMGAELTQISQSSIALV